MAASAGTDSLILVTMIPGGFHAEDGRSMSPAQLVPVNLDGLDDGKIDFKGYLTPETSDVDISKEEILVAVGRGIQNEDNLQTARELAEALGGTICASRPVVDQNWLPTTRLVGKSGKHVKPSLYLALGISGAPEHTEAITDSQAIVAVDIDPAAPIFNVADYGAEVDLLESAASVDRRG